MRLEESNAERKEHTKTRSLTTAHFTSVRTTPTVLKRRIMSQTTPRTTKQSMMK